MIFLSMKFFVCFSLESNTFGLRTIYRYVLDCSQGTFTQKVFVTNIFLGLVIKYFQTAVGQNRSFRVKSTPWMPELTLLQCATYIVHICLPGFNRVTQFQAKCSIIKNIYTELASLSPILLYILPYGLHALINLMVITMCFLSMYVKVH